MKKMILLFVINTVFVVGCSQYKSLQKTNVESNVLLVDIDLTKIKTIKKHIPILYENISIKYVNTISEDCITGSCAFGQDNSGIWLYPARIVFDLSKLSGISKITISGIDDCRENCTKAFIYGQNDSLIHSISNSEAGAFLFSFDSDIKNVKSIAISSCEAVVSNIIIE
jgi:hypothetical protein